MFHPFIVLRLVEHMLGSRLPLERLCLAPYAMRDDQLEEVDKWRDFLRHCTRKDGDVYAMVCILYMLTAGMNTKEHPFSQPDVCCAVFPCHLALPLFLGGLQRTPRVNLMF